tara:strand:+ start:30820 stop:31662 length:843 start_codon:yes stop_codon:yes gene_type:complete
MKLLSTSFLLPKINSKNKFSKLKALTLSGIELGVPLNINQNIFTNLHYGYDITTPQIILLQILIGYYTYNQDRLKDAEEYQQLELNQKEKYSTEKKELYEQLLENSEQYESSYTIVFALITVIMLYNENEINYSNLPLVILLYITNYYKEIKQKYPLIKPFYISTMWTLSTVILPCIIHDNNYDIFAYPTDYIPCFLSLFATTNLADIKDIEEDAMANIKTFPVVYGLETTNAVVLICLSLSSLIFGLNEHYLDNPIVNILFEIQNIGVAFVPLLSNYTL